MHPHGDAFNHASDGDTLLAYDAHGQSTSIQKPSRKASPRRKNAKPS
jgi:hypothetical protein